MTRSFSSPKVVLRNPGRGSVTFGGNISDFLSLRAFPVRRLVDMAVAAHLVQHSPDLLRLEERGLVVKAIMLDINRRQGTC